MASDQKALFPELQPARNGNGRQAQRLFVPKLLRDAALNFFRSTSEREEAHQILKKWADLETSGKLQKMSETSLQGEFLAEVFAKGLGYTVFSDNLNTWDLRTAYAVPDGEADAAIGLFGADSAVLPRVLVELKGPKVDIDRHRFNGRTPVQQCWDYLNVVPECPWGLVCNYVSFRLYHSRRGRGYYEHFTLQELRDINRFRQFYYLFERGGFLSILEGQKPRCEDLLLRSENRQSEVGDALYTYYHDQRLALINHLRKEPLNKSVDQSIHIAQKLFDRVIFVAFCEDRLLLPDKTLDRVATQRSPFVRVTNPLWQNFKELFRSIDQGNLAEGVEKFNGGLFAVDSEVDDLELADTWPGIFREIGQYDFKDEVNVDVLGHLFEQSITDLETVRLNPDAVEEKSSKKPLGKRKREGVYYTPPHITQAIVRRTIGPCLEVQFRDLAAQCGVDPHAKINDRNPKRWHAYQQARWKHLMQFRVCDPACGSGAFLIQAYDELQSYYDDVLAELAAIEAVDPETSESEIPEIILRENLYGVDLSEQAVEITRLALWIRTAQRGKTLADLSHNIRAGNSVVDDSQADPRRAFSWQTAFPEVFAAGGFDCIVSNPPYVKLQNFRAAQPEIAAYLISRFRSAQTGNFDLYLPFLEHGLELLKPTGRMGMIAPNVWIFNEYGRGLRELITERKALAEFVDFKSYQVFRDATTYTALQFFSPAPRETIAVADAAAGELANLQFFPVAYSGLAGDAWSLVDETDQKILEKMRAVSVRLEEATSHIFQGLITSADHIYHLTKLGPGRYYSRALPGEVEIEDEMMRPLVSGDDAVPFATPPTDTYLIFPYFASDDECRLLTADEMQQHRRCWKYLKQNEVELRKRERGKFDDDQWYRFGRNQNVDKQHLPKLGVPQTVSRLSAFNDIEAVRFFNNVRVNGILPRADGKFDLWYLLALLNSTAVDFCFRRIAKPKDRGYFEANRQFIAPLPIPKTKDQKPLGALARKLAESHSQRLEVEGRVVRRFQVDLAPRDLLPNVLPPKIPAKLAAFDETPTGELIDRLQKLAKRRFKPAERAEWDDYLTAQSRDLATVKRTISDAMLDLNERVNSLFKLTVAEIAHLQADAGSR